MEIIAIHNFGSAVVQFYSDHTFTFTNDDQVHNGFWRINEGMLQCTNTQNEWKKPRLTLEQFNVLKATYAFDRDLDKLVGK
jgi:hypothetical protein